MVNAGPAEKLSLAASSPSDLLADIRRRDSERVAADAQLPLWPEPVRGVPNGVLRSALFAAVRRGKRRYMERAAITSVKGVSILYTGPQLYQSDLDVWEGALHLARLFKLGDRVEFKEKAFLRLIGRGGQNGENLGTGDRAWLRKTLARLSATNIEIAQGPYAYGGSLIDEYFRDEKSGRYVVILNPRMRVMFGRDNWTQLDWSIRQALLGHPLAQWLHGYFSSHSSPFPIKVETLHSLCGSETGEGAKTEAMRSKALQGWRDYSLMPALKTLAHVSSQAGQPFTWEINAGLVTVTKRPSISKQRSHQGQSVQQHEEEARPWRY